MRTIKVCVFLLVAALASGCSGLTLGSGGASVNLFDGNSLDGWTRLNGTANYEVKEGAIVGQTVEGSPNSFLCTDKHYGNFELEFEVRCDEGLNSGVQIRSLLKPDTGRVFGPQVEIETSPGLSGYIYGEVMGTGWLSPEPGDDPDALRHQYFKNDEWNHFRIIAKGPRIQTFLNGQPIADLIHLEAYATHPKGFLGLQVHGVKRGTGPYQVAWRNIRIREIK